MNGLDGLGYRGANAVVTGGSSGMGEAVGRILGNLGARVQIIDIGEPSVPHERFHRTDLSDPDQVRATAAALDASGPIDFLFACAGVAHTLGALACMLVNYIGTRQIIEELIPKMPDGGGIAIVASDAGMGWQRNLAANLEFMAIEDPVAARQWCEQNPAFIRDGYSVSKEMLMVWAQHRSVSLGETRHIRINCTAPCPTQTAFTDIAAKQLAEGFFDRFPYPLLGRISTADEQAWPMILLNSPLNAVVTGAVLYTDQGYAGGVATGALQV